MSRPLVLGFCGRKGSGKDTSVLFLIAMLRENGVRNSIHVLAFADNLKKTLVAALGLSIDYFQDRGLKEAPLPKFENNTPRDLCKWIGDVFKEKFGPDFAVDRVRDEIANLSNNSTSPIVLITDVRFPNEARFIVDECGGSIIYLDASERLGLNTDQHPTEQHFPAIVSEFSDNTCFVNNNASIAELGGQLRENVYLRFFS